MSVFNLTFYDLPYFFWLNVLSAAHWAPRGNIFSPPYILCPSALSSNVNWFQVLITFTSAISAPSNQQDLYIISSFLIACMVFAATPTLSIISNPRQSAVETKLLFTHVSITTAGGECYRLNKARRASPCHRGARPYVDTHACSPRAANCVILSIKQRLQAFMFALTVLFLSAQGCVTQPGAEVGELQTLDGVKLRFVVFLAGCIILMLLCWLVF